jgi:hypothetical protein
MSGSVAAGLAKFHVGLLAAKTALNSVTGAVNTLLTSMASMDEMQKLADRVGATADTMEVLRFASEQTGSSWASVSRAVQDLTKNIARAADGAGEQSKAFQQLGLDAQAMRSMGINEQFAAIADAMQGVTNASDRMSIAQAIFGRAGREMINMLANGSEGLNAFSKEAGDLGLLLGENRRDIEAANDAINRMKRAWGGLVNQVAVAVAPALTALADIMAKIVAGFSKLFGFNTAKPPVFKATEAATAALRPISAAVETTTAKVKTAAERAADIVAKIKKENMAGMFQPEKAIGAFTRGSVAGFSAVQESHRDRRDAERRHQEQVALLTKIHAALAREGLAMVEVDL